MAGLPPKKTSGPVKSDVVTTNQVHGAMAHLAKGWKKMNKKKRAKVAAKLKNMK